MKCKVSVIIPCYNVESFLNEFNNTINSVINQSLGFENIELLLIDDKSSDNTYNILKEIQEKYSNCKAVTLNENHGTPNYARNYGIKIATTDYVMFLDNDDIYDKDICKTLYQKIIDEKVNVVGCSSRYIFNNKIEYQKVYFDNEVKINPLHNESLMKDPIWTFVNNKIYKRDFLLSNNIEFPKDARAEDFIFNIKIFLHSDMIFLNSY